RLEATIVTRLEVLAVGHAVQVPVLEDLEDASTSAPEQVLVDGRRVATMRSSGQWIVEVERPGVHVLEGVFRADRPKTKLRRHIEAALPPAGVTHVILTIPEAGIDARLAHGTLTRSRAENGGTRIEGFLDPSGRLDLSWSRTTPERGAVAAKLRSQAH